MSFTTHVSIIDGLKRDDNVAWDRFYSEYSPLIRMHGRDCGVPEDMLDDLIQNVLLSVFSSSKKFQYNSADGRYRDYIRFIIRARSADLLRGLYRKGRVYEKALCDDHVQEDSQLDALFDDEWHEHIRKNAIAQLKQESNPRHFQIFHMLDVQNREVKFVAKFFELPAATVYSIRSRLEERLRQIAEDIDT